MLRYFRRWRFEAPEMEAEFQAQMDSFARKTFNLCCGFLFFLFALLLGMRFSTVPRTTVALALPYFVGLVLLLSLLVVVRLLPAIKPYVSRVLTLMCTIIVGVVAWSVHGLVGQSTHNALDLRLVRVVALLQGHVDAQAELELYVRAEQSRKYWYLAFLVMFITIDALRLTGATLNALYLHLTPLVAVVAATYCSNQISPVAIDSLGIAAIFTVYTMTSSLHMQMAFRDRFRFDYRLRQRMAREAEVMEVAKDVEVAQRQASQKADSMLNHILKNIMAEAHGCIDLFFGNRTGSDAADDHLRRSQESLERGMRWCRKRQVMVQVNSGDYTPALAPTNLQKLIDGMVSGRDIHVDIPDVTVCLDALLCEVVLDNAISNAFRHGDASLGPVALAVTTEPGKEHSLEITFTLTNFVPEGHPPVTPELLESFAAGQEVGVPVNVPALSDHLGLRHMFLAATAHGIRTALEQVGSIVMFTAVLEADLDCGSGTDFGSGCPLLPGRPAAAAFPPGLRILCLDDSEIARRVLLHGFAACAEQTKSQAYGATAGEVVAFEADALSGADMVVLDQYLDYHHVTVFGTDIAQRLRRAGYAGFICIRSANATEEDEAVYLRSGADCVIGKDVPLRDMVETLQLAYEHHVRVQRLRQSPIFSRGRYEELGVSYAHSGSFSSNT